MRIDLFQKNARGQNGTEVRMKINNNTNVVVGTRAVKDFTYSPRTKKDVELGREYAVFYIKRIEMDRMLKQSLEKEKKKN